jgi:hypothetical protein
VGSAIYRDVITTDLICKEEEKKDFIPSSDINVPHEISPANEPGKPLIAFDFTGCSQNMLFASLLQ